MAAHVDMHGEWELNGEDGSQAHSLAGPVGFEPTTYGLGVCVDLHVDVHCVMHISTSLPSLVD
jgi:hypothetical protein